MKKIIPFKKDIVFKSKVNEITSISLEHNLNFKEDDVISGEFHISGDYKMTETSINREAFDYKIPFEIALDSRYDVNNITIDIDDFYYEVINDEILRVNIDLFIDGNEIIEAEPETFKSVDYEPPIYEELNMPKNIIEERNNIDMGDSLLEDKKLNSLNEEVEIRNQEEIVIDPSNIFDSIDSKETYATYRVYIVREEDTIEKITLKYNITKEDLSIYNDLNEIKLGDKLIIPTINNG